VESGELELVLQLPALPFLAGPFRSLFPFLLLGGEAALQLGLGGVLRLELGS
jgi:hypothetical protein